MNIKGKKENIKIINVKVRDGVLKFVMNLEINMVMSFIVRIIWYYVCVI